MTKIAVVTGISGVGKTSLIKCVMKDVPGQFLSASQLIRDELNSLADEQVQHDDLRKLDIGNNQKALIEGFKRSANPDAGVVVLDAHVVIDTPTGLTILPSDVFAALKPTLFIFVEGDPACILRQRSEDSSRERPFRDTATIAAHQLLAKQSSHKIASEIRVPFFVTPSGDKNSLRELLTVENGVHLG